MHVTRIDLDGAGSPLGLVAKILKAEPNLTVPVPIEELAYQLDIGEIAELKTEGFEGGLLTDIPRSFGGILVRKGMDPRRRRFTIGHELGHFLLPFHKPARPGEFLCSRKDMQRWTASEQDRAARMEVEANQFSAAMLMPPPHLRSFLGSTGDPNLKNVLALHETFDVSKEAAARAYSQYQGEKLAILIVKDGKILRIYRSPGFPLMGVRAGDPVPKATAYGVTTTAIGSMTGLRQIGAEQWLQSDWGVPLPHLYEQVMFQNSGFAMILLWAEISDDDDYDPDEGRTSKERYKARLNGDRY